MNDFYQMFEPRTRQTTNLFPDPFWSRSPLTKEHEEQFQKSLIPEIVKTPLQIKEASRRLEGATPLRKSIIEAIRKHGAMSVTQISAVINSPYKSVAPAAESMMIQGILERELRQYDKPKVQRYFYWIKEGVE